MKVRNKNITSENRLYGKTSSLTDLCEDEVKSDWREVICHSARGRRESSSPKIHSFFSWGLKVFFQIRYADRERPGWVCERVKASAISSQRWGSPALESSGESSRWREQQRILYFECFIFCPSISRQTLTEFLPSYICLVTLEKTYKARMHKQNMYWWCRRVWPILAKQTRPSPMKVSKHAWKLRLERK